MRYASSLNTSQCNRSKSGMNAHLIQALLSVAFYWADVFSLCTSLVLLLAYICSVAFLRTHQDPLCKMQDDEMVEEVGTLSLCHEIVESVVGTSV